MRVMGIDLETSGTDFNKDEILEVGICIREIEDGVWQKKPIHQGSYLLFEPHFPNPMPQEVYDIHHISYGLLEEAGVNCSHFYYLLKDLLMRLKVEVIVAHRGLKFDKPFLLSKTECHGWLCKFLDEVPWIDTSEHIDYPSDCYSTSLLFLAAYHGFINPFPHDALSDVHTMMKILSFYPFDEVLSNSKEKVVRIKAEVTYDDRELAKKRGYKWNQTEKIWEKSLRESKIEEEKRQSPFQVLLLNK